MNRLRFERVGQRFLTLRYGPARQQNRLCRSRIRHMQHPRRIVPQRNQHRDVLRVQPALLQLIVQRCQERSRREMLRSQRPQNARNQRSIERRRSRLAGNIAHHDQSARRRNPRLQHLGRPFGERSRCVGPRSSRQVSVQTFDRSRTIVQKVVQVAADRARRPKAARDLGIRRRRRHRRQQPQLHLPCHLQIALHPLLFLVDALVQIGIRNRDGDLRGQRGQRALVILVVVVHPRVFQVDDADHLALIDQRSRQLGARLRVLNQVARLPAHIRSQNRRTLERRGADQPLAQRDAAPPGHPLSVPRRKPMLKPIRPPIPKQNREHLEVDHALQQAADPLQQIVRIEDRGDLPRDLMQHRQRLRLPRHPRVKPRILNRNRHPRRRQLQQSLMVRREEGRQLRLQIEYADYLILHNQRHRQLRPHRVIGVDVVLYLPYIFDQNRLALQRRLPGDAAPQLDANPLRIDRVPGLKAHPQLVRAVVDQQDGKDAIVDHRSHQVRHTMQQGIQVERRVQSVRKPDQKVQLHRFNTNIWLSRMLVKQRTDHALSGRRTILFRQGKSAEAGSLALTFRLGKGLHWFGRSSRQS